MSCDKTPTTGKYTLAAEARKFEAKRAHKEQLKLAVALVASGEAGGPGSVVGLVEGCTRSQTRTACNKAAESEVRAAWEIRTEPETNSLVKWLLTSAWNDNPATEAEVSDKVKELLQHRRLFNRKHQSESRANACVPLTSAEERNGLKGGSLSHT